MSVSYLLLLSFFLIISTAHAELHKEIAAAKSHCLLNGCQNGGYCSYTKYTDYPRIGDVGWFQSCVCRPGFGGGACEKKIEECQPPLFKCSNGAPCERNEDDGSLYCDCSAADKKSDLAGYQCREPAVQVCDTIDENNKSYCTNGGVCLSSMSASSNHLMFSEPTVHEGCQCDEAFYGDHCEFLRDMPESRLMKEAQAQSEGKKGGAKAGILVSLFAICAMIVGSIIVRRKRRQIKVRLEESWKAGEEKFRQFYVENLGLHKKDSMIEEDDDDADGQDEGTEKELQVEDLDLGEEEEEGDLQSALDRIAAGATVSFDEADENQFV